MGPLTGKRVLVTRAAGDEDELVEALQESGAVALLAPTIGFAAPDSERQAELVLNRLDDFAWLMFTSARGVQAFFERLLRSGQSVAALDHLRIAAVGPKTAAQIERFGARVDLMPERFDARETAEAIVAASSTNDRILLFRAQEGRESAIEVFTAAHRSWNDVAGYKTVHLHDGEIARQAALADVLTFASGSAAVAFCENVTIGEWTGKTVACIGPACASVARSCGLHVDVIANEPTARGLVDALEGYFTQAATCD